MFADATFSYPVSTIGLVLPFVLTDMPLSAGTLGTPVSNAVSLTVTWINQNGLQRALTLSNAASATFTYTVSVGDTRAAHLEVGYLQISHGTDVLMTATFTMNVVPHF